MEPHVVMAQPTAHVTPMFAESFITCAATLRLAPACNVVLLSGDTVTEIGSLVYELPPPQPERNPMSEKFRIAKERKALLLMGPPKAKAAQL